MRSLFLLIGMSLLFASCGSDEEEAALHYDQDNFSAPELEIGIHEAAARFTAAATSTLLNQSLVEVDYYILDVPAACEVIVYGEGSGATPGDILYSANVSQSVRGESWNKHVLTTPVEITGTDLWIAVRVTHDAFIGSIGCDPGPANNNGDWAWADSDNEWITLRDRTNQDVNINWNIRGHVR